ncbi:MAG: mechanosensitive ion channel [Salinivirgaceae bacterium]|nr:mechanosensitive ion channel [Salinivirgaceae bacterium]MDY0280537.1 mechanosensitive ion channel [Salinivirgaceae bacterium]
MEEKVSVLGSYFVKIMDFGFEFGFKIIGGIIVLIIGLWIAKLITKSVGKALVRSNVDQSLVPFFKNLTNIVLKILVIITVMSLIGIQMTSFIAILGAAGLAVGMALSGTLQNFAGGVIILAFKPFKIGDFIEAQGYLGTVKEISVFATSLNTVDKKLIIIPNGPLSTGSLTNFSAELQRRVDWTFGIAYGDNIDDFKRAINDFIAEDPRILKEPASFIGLSELGGSSVNFSVKVWVNSPDYWDVFFEMNEKVYKRFGDYNLHIPFPQMDIHLHDKK